MGEMRRIVSGGLLALALAIVWLVRAPDTSRESSGIRKGLRGEPLGAVSPIQGVARSGTRLQDEAPSGNEHAAPRLADQARTPSTPDARASRSDGGPLSTRRRAIRSPLRREVAGEFDRRVLEDLGVEPERIQKLERVWNDDLHVQTSQGEGENERNFGARGSRDVQNAVCPALSGAECDDILYATGHRNRIAIASVPDGSLGSQLGLRAGDEIIGIEGERVFSIFEIQPALRGGEPLGAPLSAVTPMPLE
jgi:membrane-associated protease RseP (regulator of RpoE activity)